jgi:plastocyanin
MISKKLSTYRTIGRIAAEVLIVSALVLAAKTQVVQFGGALGFAYSPNSFSAKVGDTVEWQGDFTMHPISSTTVPANAPSWHNATGASFTYVIMVPGTYSYQCDIHVSLGMTGSFEATGSGVKDAGRKPDLNRTLNSVSVNVERPLQPLIKYYVPQSGSVRIDVFDLLGHTLSTPVDQIQAAGFHTVPFPAKLSGSGLFFVKLIAGGAEIVKTVRISGR